MHCGNPELVVKPAGKYRRMVAFELVCFLKPGRSLVLLSENFSIMSFVSLWPDTKALSPNT